MGINLDTLRPEPCVEGYTTPGGYSSKVRPCVQCGASSRGWPCEQASDCACACDASRCPHPRPHTPAQAVKPIALAKVMAIAQMIAREFPGSGASLSGIGGVNTGRDAAEFILLGADTVQARVCVGGAGWAPVPC